VWRDRYGGIDRGDHHCRHQRDERIALEKHARERGCRIIIDPSIECKEWGPLARKTRLETLVEFLDSTADDKAEVAICEGMGGARNLTLLATGLRRSLYSARSPRATSRPSSPGTPQVSQVASRSSTMSSMSCWPKPGGRPRLRGIWPSRRLRS
jgi:hypothetical protein